VGQLAAFFVLTFVVSWICFFGSAQIASPGASPAAGMAGAIYIVGVFSPALVALALTAQATGRGGVLALVRRMVQAPWGMRWYVFALGYMVCIKLTAALLYRLVGGGWPLLGGRAVVHLADRNAIFNACAIRRRTGMARLRLAKPGVAFRARMGEPQLRRDLGALASAVLLHRRC
jgi:hypothetical protein